MSTKTAFTYTVLRYVHDIVTGEFLNVGVALLSPDHRFVDVRCRQTYSRLKDVFPSLNGDSFRATMRHVVREFRQFHDELAGDSTAKSMETTVATYAHAVLGPDDSSLQWSPIGAGLTADPEATLDQLYERFVIAHEPRPASSRRQDEDVWRHFSRELEQRQILRHFRNKTIAVEDDRIEFRHAWKNGIWHCLAPVSFDLATADSIREKAHKWLGQLTSVSGAEDDFKLYFLVGEPASADLLPAFASAVSILEKSKVQREVVREAEAESFGERLAAELLASQNVGQAIRPE